jgi:hypothetical protein
LRAEVGYNPELAAKHDDGIFWISWDDVLRYFQNVQLSWNPALFSFRVTTHSFWPKEQGPLNDTFNVGENPQYVMVLSKEAIAKKGHNMGADLPACHQARTRRLRSKLQDFFFLTSTSGSLHSLSTGQRFSYDLFVEEYRQKRADLVSSRSKFTHKRSLYKQSSRLGPI